MNRLEGKVAIVTGAASGIGRATALRFAEEGARVVAADLDLDRVRTVLGDAVLALDVDVADQASVAELFGRTKDEHGRVDVLAHFAGITKDAMASKLELDAWEEVLRVNLTGTFLTARAAAVEMRAGGGGSIILTSSRSYLGNIGQSNYAASKGGVVSLTRTLALEYGKWNVRVNALAPGYIETPMTAAIPERVRHLALEGTPLQRAGRPEEVAAATLFLASDDASYITGIVLAIDGGRTTGFAPA
ncbi:MAG TPA: SDR family oxidoreductase [Candidatus Baltobacteraceae bacterium]